MTRPGEPTTTGIRERWEAAHASAKALRELGAAAPLAEAELLNALADIRERRGICLTRAGDLIVKGKVPIDEFIDRLLDKRLDGDAS